MEDTWYYWISRNPKPIKRFSKLSKQAKCQLLLYDDRFKQFTLDKSSNLRFEKVNSQDRFWIHTRADQLGMFSQSISNKEDKTVKDIIITKPNSWVFDSKRVVQPKSSAHEKKVTVMKSWKTTCDNCSTSLDAYSALYNWRGLGPLCEECIENDDELNGLKWEAKAEFI